ncbi:O-antigen ligase family protein [Enterococcus faecalis]|uniref:O-antigen polymerase n=1 Tax=Enterococcus faecalis RP2S-4 TaxID=1244145 RepID=A0ABC9TNL1_ENTFL|nr:O-antigen ligase family protein [Enterococcus faecalis]EPI12591.1 O-antigen polymerase [Enterococcus faecalis RP2S-4]
MTVEQLKIWNTNAFLLLVTSTIWGHYLSLPFGPTVYAFQVLFCAMIVVFISTLPEKNSTINISKNVRRIFLLYFVWIAFSVLSLLWSSYLMDSFKALYYEFEELMLMFFCIVYITDIASLMRVFKVVVVNFFILIPILLRECITGVHLSVSQGNNDRYGRNLYTPTGMMYGTNDMAVVLVLFLIVAICYLSSKKMYKTSFLIYVISAYILYFTDSRSAMVGFLIVTIITIYGYFKKNIFVTSLLFVFLTLAFLIVLGSKKEGAIKYIQQIFHNVLSKQGSTETRFQMYKYAWNLFISSNGVGVGVGNAYRPMGMLLRYNQQLLYNMNIFGETSVGVHNFFLQVLSETGIAGFLSMAGFYVYTLINSIQVFIKKQDLLNLVPLTICIMFFCASVGSSSIFNMRIIWLFFGIGLSVLNLLGKEMES